jgi:hypothetical protein
MQTHTPFIIGGIGLFLTLSVIWSQLASPHVRQIYLHYALYLSFILLYFLVGVGVDASSKAAEHLEAVLFAGAAITYLLFARTLFLGRESFGFLNDILQLGIFAVLACLAAEKTVYFFAGDLPYIQLISALLRGFICLLGLYAMAKIYLKYPADRRFFAFFLGGASSLLVGGLLTASLSLIPEFAPGSTVMAIRMSGAFCLFIMQAALLLEILCFSVFIYYRQLSIPTASMAIAVPGHYTLAIEATEVAPQQKRPQLRQEKPSATLPPAVAQGSTTPLCRVAFRTSKGFDLMKKSDILLVQGGGNGANFIKVYREGQANPVIALHTLAHTFRLLSEGDSDFQQPHRSYILNVQKICRLYRDEDGVMMAVMDNGMEVPISAERVPAIKALLGLE